ncbi:MAG: CRISPR-associated protein Cas2 [Treponema sp.]|nr:CRISPR-associated protein Cas2 [Treponema sp.]
MFVSVIVEPAGLESAQSLTNLLTQSGFTKIQKGCWECMKVSESGLAQLKSNIDRVTDYYDRIRIYQFPVGGMFVITELSQKRWRRCQMKGSVPGK